MISVLLNDAASINSAFESHGQNFYVPLSCLIFLITIIYSDLLFVQQTTSEVKKDKPDSQRGPGSHFLGRKAKEFEHLDRCR